MIRLRNRASQRKTLKASYQSSFVNLKTNLPNLLRTLVNFLLYLKNACFFRNYHR